MSYDPIAALPAVQTGTILPWVTDTAPSGYLLCYGQAVSRATYADLFAVIGITFGPGDGSTTFNVPDLRGRYPLGKDDMGGVSANRVTASEADNIGQGAGVETHTLTISEMPSHYHGLRWRTAFSGGGVDLADVGSYGGNDGTTNSMGGGQSHQNMPPYQTTTWIIKT